MNTNKKRIALIAAVVGVALCVALLVFSCGGPQDGPASVPSETTSVPTEQTALETSEAVTEGTTEATEETTEPTEETTEATEETTAEEDSSSGGSTSGGNTPGGTGGFEGGTTGTPSGPKPEEITVTDAPGTQKNPYAEVLSGVPDAVTTVMIPAKGEIYYYLTNVQGAVLTLADADASVVMGEVTYTPEEGVVSVTIPAPADPTKPEAVMIKLANGGEEKSFTVEFAGIPGTLGNPIVIADAEKPFEVQIPSGETVYYQGLLGGMTMTIPNAQDSYVLVDEIKYEPDENGTITVSFPAAMGRPQPVIFALCNNGTAEEPRSYVMTFVLPTGTMDHPAELLEGENVATLEAGSEGYYYKWTAVENGTLTLTMADETVNTAGWQYTITNLTTGEATELFDHANTSWYSTYDQIVTAGDELLIWVNTFNSEDVWTAPAGSVTLTAQFKKLGTELNPIRIQDPGMPMDVTVPAGQMVYLSGGVHGMTMTIENAAGASVVMTGNTVAADANGVITLVFPEAGGMGRVDDAVFALHNGTDTEGTYTLKFTYPLGHPGNPQPLVLGENTVTVKADTEGYYYQFIAETNGELTIEMTCADWGYCVSNLTAGTLGDNHYSDEDPAQSSETVTVSAGDEIQVTVNTSFATAGTITFQASFAGGPGSSAENPIELYYSLFPYTTASIAPQQTVYYKARGVAGQTLTVEGAVEVTVNGTVYGAVDGKVTVDDLPGDMRNPTAIAVKNLGDAPAAFVLQVEEPLGSVNRPAALVLGTNSITLEAGLSDGYYYTWTAQEDGVLTITMEGQNWQYFYDYAPHGYDEADAAVLEIEMKAGDKLDFSVNTYNAEDPYVTPGGTVTFQADFVSDAGTEANPIQLVFRMFPYTTSSIAPQKAVCYSATGIYGRSLIVEGEVEVTVEGTFYAAENGRVVVRNLPGGPRAPTNIIIRNAGNAASSFVLRVEENEGTLDKPAEMVLGTNSITLEAGEDEGYYYTWTPEKDGILTITMEGQNWQYVYNYETVSYSPDGTNVLEIPAEAGKEIDFSVLTYDANDPNAYPAGTVTFEASFAEPLGSEGNPIAIYGAQFPYTTDPIGAGQTVYYTLYQGAGQLLTVPGATVTVNGAAYAGTELPGDRRTPVTLAVTNDGAVAAQFTMTLAMPVGTIDNPEEIELGENKVTVGNNGEAYYYTWTAPKAGVLTITVDAEKAEHGWQYQVESKTTGVMNDLYDHDSTPESTATSYTVKAGEKLVLMIATFDANDPYNAPAGEVEFILSFAETKAAQKPAAQAKDETVPEKETEQPSQEAAEAPAEMPVEAPKPEETAEIPAE